ncbi:MAG TPA: histidine kinase dimerization/phosphoacceptor domain -containing protein [Sphingobium sp.]
MAFRWLEWMERLPIAKDRPAVGYVFAVLATAVSLLVRMAAAGALPGGYPFVTFFPTVILSAFLFGTGPGLAAGVLSWFAARYFFIAPVGSFGFGPGVIGAALFFWLVVVIDIGIIHLVQRANRLLREQRNLSARRHEVRDAMFQELQHRVSNKLQIIASLLTLQRRTVMDPDAQKALEDAALRVGMIGRISRALHDPDRGGLGIPAFLEQVGRDIIEQSGAPNVHLRVDSEPGLEFADDAGVPIALILAETISNALEHGFRSRGNGRIEVVVRRGEDGRLLILVTDDGQGVGADFDAATSSSLGLKIAVTLARQLNGTYRLSSGVKGTVARLEVQALAGEAIAFI